ILKVSEPLELKGNLLKIGFKYAFHQQRVKQSKVLESFEKNLLIFFGEELHVETSLLPQDYESPVICEEARNDEGEMVEELPSGAGLDQQALIDTLVKTFNGKIIE